MFVWSLVDTETVVVTELSGSHLHGSHREHGSCLYGVWWTLRLLMLQNCLGLIYTVHIENMTHVCMESGGH